MFSIIIIVAFILLITHIIYVQKAGTFEIIAIIVAIGIIITMSQQSLQTYPTMGREYFDSTSGSTANKSGLISSDPALSDAPCTSACTAAQQGLVYGQIIAQPGDPTLNRNKDIIYINDIVNFYIPNTSQKLIVKSGEVQIKTSDQPQSYLQKLRIISAIKLPTKMDALKLYPIHYGDQVKLFFTMGRTMDYYLTNNKILGLSKADKFNVFQLVNANSPQSQDIVRNNDTILLKSYSEASGSLYIKISDINQISTNNTLETASPWTITMSQECNPNWMFDYEDPHKHLFKKAQVNQILGKLLQNETQNSASLKTLSSTSQTASDDAYMKQMKVINIERALLQAQIDKIKAFGNVGTLISS
jgi:hypothetical protein